MKLKTIALALILAAVSPLTAVAEGSIPDTIETRTEQNYMAEIITALAAGDLETARNLNGQRDEKIDSLIDCPYVKVDCYDLFLLGKIMTLEAGNCPYDECARGVGEVCANRVASPEFPDTYEEVLKQRGQYYYPSLAGMFDRALPSERCLKLALRLLEGERHLEPSVVFHSNSVIGSAVHSSYKHEGHSTLYFGYSYNKNLYE